VEKIKIRRSRRIRKTRKIKTQPLCGEYPSWVPYLSFEEEDCESFFCMILHWMWLGRFFWGRSVYVTLKRKEINMEASCTFIIVMENG
jgi:hypothetical protein